MPPRNRGKSARSKSRGRSCKKDLQSAVSDAHTTSLGTTEALSSLSQPSNSGLPLNYQNKTSPETVSASPTPLETNKAPHDKSSPSPTISNEVVQERKIIEASFDDINSKCGHAAVSEVSDNTAPSLETTPTSMTTHRVDVLSSPLHPLWPDKRNSEQEDPFSSNPEDPWHFF